MLDAYRSARRSRQGYDLASEDVRVRSLLQRNSTYWRSHCQLPGDLFSSTHSGLLQLNGSGLLSSYSLPFSLNGGIICAEDCLDSK
jgi:hypothetical protein